MSDLCRYWKDLLADLAASPDDPALSDLDAEARGSLLKHILACDVCMDDRLLAALDTCSESVVKARAVLSAFLSSCITEVSAVIPEAPLATRPPH